MNTYIETRHKSLKFEESIIVDSELSYCFELANLNITIRTFDLNTNKETIILDATFDNLKLETADILLHNDDEIYNILMECCFLPPNGKEISITHKDSKKLFFLAVENQNKIIIHEHD